MEATVTYSIIFDDDIFENEEKKGLFYDATEEEREEFLKNQFINYLENSSPNPWDLTVKIKK